MRKKRPCHSNRKVVKNKTYKSGFHTVTLAVRNAIKYNTRHRVGKQALIFAMQNQPSRTMPVITGFALCIFLMLTISFVAFYVNHVNRSILNELQSTNDLRYGIERLRLDLADVQIAVLRYRETSDPTIAEEVAARCTAIRKDIMATEQLTYRVEEKKKMVNIIEYLDKYAQDFPEEVKISERLMKENAAWTEGRIMLFDSLDKIESSWENSEAKNVMRQVRESVFPIILRQRDLASPDQKRAQAATDDIQKRWEDVRGLLDECRERSVTAEMKKTLEDVTVQNEKLMNLTMRLAELHAHQRAIRQQADTIIAEMSDRSDDIVMNILEPRLFREGHVMEVFYQQAVILLTICSIVAVVISIVTCIVVVLLVNRKSSSVYSEGGFSGTGTSPSGDMRIVADRLQEVVNLLRK